MDKTTVKATLAITGDDFDPILISEFLGISPTIKWKAGELFRNNKMVRKFSRWNVEGERVESVDVFNQAKGIMDIFLEKVDRLKSLRSKYNLYYNFLIIVRIYQNQAPLMHFNNALLSFLNGIGASLDIDSYISGVEIFPLPPSEDEMRAYQEDLFENMYMDVKFCIFGKGFNPNEITELLGIQPTEVFADDDYTDSSRNQYNISLWCLSYSDVKSVILDEQIEKIISILSHKISTLNYIKSKYNTSYEVCAAANSYNCHGAVLFVENARISFLNSIGAELNIDYFIQPCEPPEI